jgi:hypothetical protein
LLLLSSRLLLPLSLVPRKLLTSFRFAFLLRCWGLCCFLLKTRIIHFFPNNLCHALSESSVCCCCCVMSSTSGT